MPYVLTCGLRKCTKWCSIVSGVMVTSVHGKTMITVRLTAHYVLVHPTVILAFCGQQCGGSFKRISIRLLGEIRYSCVGWIPIGMNPIVLHNGCRDIASLCMRKGLYVLSGDSDFFLFPVKGVIWLFDTLRSSPPWIKNKKIGIFRQETVLRKMDISLEEFKRVCLLMGNDYAPNVLGMYFFFFFLRYGDE